MKKILIALLLLTSVAPVFAQQPTASPREQALSSKLMEEINQNIDFRRALIEAQAIIEELKKQIAKAQEAPKEGAK